MSKQKTSKKPVKRASQKLLVLLVIACFFVGGVATWKFLEITNRKSDDASKNTADEELNNQQKDNSAKDDESIDDNPENKPTDENETPTDTRKTVTIFIVDSSQYDADGVFEVAAYVEKISEDNGICTITLEKGAEKLSKVSKGLSGASTTDCTTVDFPLASFKESGTWHLTITYDSSKSLGEVKKDVTIRR